MIEPPPAFTVQQEADLRCVNLGLALQADTFANGEFAPDGERMVRFYMRRLNRNEPRRNWSLIAKPISLDIRYGDFMTMMNVCYPPMGRSPPRDVDH